MNRSERSGRRSVPLKPYRSILEAEVHQAVGELKRPAIGLIMSGMIAGFGIGTSVLAMGVIMTLGADGLSDLALRLLMANAYAIGFTLVVLSNTDLFTEYTTIALLPVMTGDAPWRSLLRLWGIIYVSNLVGAFLFALLLVAIGPGLEVASHDVLGEIGRRVVGHPSWLIFLSALLAGWLMGLMSWLVSAGRETISQIFFVWIIAGIIGLGHLHHVVIGSVELFAALLVDGPNRVSGAGRFLFWVTAGNVAGSAIFAAVIRYSVLLRGQEREGSSARR